MAGLYRALPSFSKAGLVVDAAVASAFGRATNADRLALHGVRHYTWAAAASVISRVFAWLAVVLRWGRGWRRRGRRASSRPSPTASGCISPTSPSAPFPAAWPLAFTRPVAA
eukprot:TRINITY_DN5676_c0_g1_i1.p2 TRINITY_DN5676_c0_g1~~TRINITY_DN5676_c0_g1_i1.p2  ORF type:complete len:112 (+),score=18.22 TRINITY_DN5676_c0_g1_i1:201-536(+)